MRTFTKTHTGSTTILSNEHNAGIFESAANCPNGVG